MKLGIVGQNREISDTHLDVLTSVSAIVTKYESIESFVRSGIVLSTDVVIILLVEANKDAMRSVIYLREFDQELPIIVIYNCASVEAQIQTFAFGADVVLVHPFYTPELVAHTIALARHRTPWLKDTSITRVPAYDSRSRRFLVAGLALDLTPHEFSILDLLAKRENKLVTRVEIDQIVFNCYEKRISDPVRVHIHSLRQKLEKAGAARVIETVRGKGFILAEKAK